MDNKIIQQNYIILLEKSQKPLQNLRFCGLIYKDLEKRNFNVNKYNKKCSKTHRISYKT